MTMEAQAIQLNIETSDCVSGQSPITTWWELFFDVTTKFFIVGGGLSIGLLAGLIIALFAGLVDFRC